MSDFFGIGAAIRGAVQIYFRSARQTGRTISLLENVKNGDRVVFVDPKQADLFKRLCHVRRIEVECVVCDPKKIGDLISRGPAKNRTIFDHVWVEQFYQNGIENAGKFIDEMQYALSSMESERPELKFRHDHEARWDL